MTTRKELVTKVAETIYADGIYTQPDAKDVAEIIVTAIEPEIEARVEDAYSRGWDGGSVGYQEKVDAAQQRIREARAEALREAADAAAHLGIFSGSQIRVGEMAAGFLRDRADAAEEAGR